MDEGDIPDRIARWSPLFEESRESLIGRVVAADEIQGILIDLVHRMDPTIASDEDFRKELEGIADSMTVDSLIEWDNEIMAGFSDAMIILMRSLFPAEE